MTPGNGVSGSVQSNLQDTKASNLKELKTSHETAYSTRFEKKYKFLIYI